MIIATYLMFDGRCEEALNTYEKLFNAEVICMHKFDQTMTNDSALIDKIFHAELKIKEFYLYMSDTSEGLDYNKQAYRLTVECDTLEQAQLYFDTLKAEGAIIESFGKTPFGMYLGHLQDKFGIQWHFVYSPQQQ